MKSFNWQTSTDIRFGKNKIQDLANLLQFHKVKKVLLTYGYASIKKNGIFNATMEQLKKGNIETFELANIAPNPRYESVLEGANICKKENIDLILAVGGGSIVDCSKAISLAYGYNGKDFWNDIIKTGKGPTIEKILPVGVILTLAATGSEMNKGAVISNLATKEKLGLFSSKAPLFSILDPEYTYSVPKNQIAAGATDAFSHCLEQYFSPEDDAIVSDNILLGIMRSIKTVARKAMDNPNDYTSHANLMWSATMALNYITAVGKTGDWATHAMEHAVSAYYDITHAVGLAIITPYWLEYVLNENNAYRFQNLGKVVFDIQATNNAIEDAKKTIQAVAEFFKSLDMPNKLSAVGVEDKNIDGMVTSTFAHGASNIGNFRILDAKDVKTILTNAL